MKILIVEDELDKREQLSSVLLTNLGAEIEIYTCGSLHSSIKLVAFNEPFDLALIDMSMPNYDISASEPTGGDPESFAGKELIYQMKMRGKLCPLIIVTQYRSFEKGKVDLLDLDNEFSSEFEDYYLGYVYYNPAVDGWVESLESLISGVKK
ncbi:response regulator [Pantoea ananatis]|uniref:response regulator n=1 Tax=Pantoea ananas TaxID=553 RepID=UPI000CF4242B|nr:response regulator [Pantoea ananatis]PQK69955.1 hypothetical protein CG427_20530 [Pantoea ananatis]PQK82988.1 hypothetical protein CG431_20525 [Pantoea ananatis]